GGAVYSVRPQHFLTCTIVDGNRATPPNSWRQGAITSMSAWREVGLSSSDDRLDRCKRSSASIYPRRTLAPPSTGKVTPVMKLASSEATKSAAFATSQAVP